MATHSSEIDQYNKMEERLRREASLSQLGLLALSSSSLSVVLEMACRMTAETLALDSVRIVKLNNLESSCLTVAQYGENALPGQFHGCDAVARFAAAQAGQMIISDLKNETRFPLDGSSIGSVVATAIAICIFGSTLSTFRVLCGYCQRQATIDSEQQRFIARIIEILARAIRRETSDQELRELKARYLALFESAADAIICIGADANLIDVNSAAVSLLGYTKRELLTMNLYALLAPESHAITRKAIEEKLMGRRRTTYESSFIAKSGEIIPAEVNSSVHDRERDAISIQGIVRDLRSRKLAEQALVASEARFRSVVESAMVGIVFSSVEGHITDANETFLSMVGYSQDDLKQGKLKDELLTPPEYHNVDIKALERLRSGAKLIPFEKEYVRKNGARIPVLIGEAFLGDSKTEVVAFVSDLTEQKQLQKQFQHAQKMEAVGQLVGGIAHDFNNILMAISSFAELLYAINAPDTKKQSYTQQILAACARAAELVKQLLVLGPRHVSQQEPVNLNRVLEESQNLVRQMLGPKCELSLDLTSDPLRIIADRVQLQQMVLNIASNARDAMREGGVFRVSVARLELTSPHVNQQGTVPPGSYASLTFADTGVGIAPEIIPRIFEPFFTTKTMGEGTGLGLAMVYGLVKHLGGYIFIESKLGSGAEFTVLLRLTDKPALEAKKDLQTDATHLRAVGTGILLVDDELQIRVSCAEYLRQLGYTIFEAANAEKALNLFELNPSQIKLLLTDLVMPGMGGIELARELRQRDPQLAVIFISGFSRSSNAELQKVSFSEMLAKPVALADLADVIARMLRQQHSERGEVSK
jgi:two-component system, cell cycle sensor histidine kinase and response regulator CckA